MNMKEKLQALTRKQKLIAVVCAGLLILILLWPVQKQGTTVDEIPTVNTSQQEGNDTLESYVNYQEKRLKSIIEKIDGAGTVYVMITAKASREIIVEKDTQTSSDKTDETDSNGGTRSVVNQSSQESTVMYDSQSGQSQPYVVKSLEPEIEGVVVAAQGADDAVVAQEIVNTVTVLFDVPAHKIKVVHME